MRSLAATPDSKAPSSFDDPTKIEFTDDTRPNRCDGVSTCSSVDRTSTLTLSAIPLTARTIDRDGKASRQSEADDAQRERRHCVEHRSTGALEGRTMRQIYRRHDRARRRRGAQNTESLRPDVQNLIGEHRQQRFGAAEQYGEEVERQRRQQHRLSEHEAQAETQTLANRLGPSRSDSRRSYSIHENEISAIAIMMASAT